MIGIICGTNRKESITRKISEIYRDIFAKFGVDSKIVDLAKLPSDFIFTALYEKSGTHDTFNKYVSTMISAEKFVFIVPEYNGSFPGVLKAFIDGLKFPESFEGKKCALVGLSAGQQGAGLALSHLSDILNYCGMHVLALKPRLAYISKNMEEDIITNDLYVELLETQAKALMSF